MDKWDFDGEYDSEANAWYYTFGDDYDVAKTQCLNDSLNVDVDIMTGNIIGIEYFPDVPRLRCPRTGCAETFTGEHMERQLVIHWTKSHVKVNK